MTAALLPDFERVADMPTDAVFEALGTRADGLTSAEAKARLESYGRNVLRSHTVRAASVLARQVRNPLLLLLLAAATVSGFVGQGTDAVIIGVIVTLSVGLGFVNEYRSE